MPGYRKQRSSLRVSTALFAVFALALPGIFAVAQKRAIDEAPRDPVFRVVEERSDLKIIDKFAKVIELPTRIVRVDGFDPEVVDVNALSPYQIRVQAKQAGVTQIVLTDENDQTFSVELLVIGDVRHLQAYLNRLFPHDAVDAVEIKGSVVLRGWVTQPAHINEIVSIAEQFYPEVLNQMTVGGAQQVLLKCQVMEVQRSKVRELGINFLFLNQDSYLVQSVGPITPITALSAPFGGPPTVALDGFADSTLTWGLINSNNIFQGFIEAMKEEGLLKIKAEPSLVTTNGRPATLLQGGEFPIVVPAGLGTVAIEWREFGVRMEAVPIILGEGRLRLELQPEVSERDFSSSVSVNGTNVPGLTVRRANTQVEMGFGETLVIAGLISNRKTAVQQKVPFMGDLPYVGAWFSKKRYEDVETELVITVTPEYVAALRPDQKPQGYPGAFSGTPSDKEFYHYNMIEVPNYGDECNLSTDIPPFDCGGRCGTANCNGSCGLFNGLKNGNGGLSNGQGCTSPNCLNGDGSAGCAEGCATPPHQTVQQQQRRTPQAPRQVQQHANPVQPPTSPDPMMRPGPTPPPTPDYDPVPQRYSVPQPPAADTLAEPPTDTGYNVPFNSVRNSGTTVPRNRRIQQTSGTSLPPELRAGPQSALERPVKNAEYTFDEFARQHLVNP